MVEDLDRWSRALGPWGAVAFGLAAFIEYVFPPFPGDTVTLLAGVYAVRGEQPWLLVFVAVTAGSVLGAAADYGVGRLVATRVERQPEGRLFFGVTHARIRRAQATMKERGAAVILVNRFVPAFRALVFVAAGASRMPAKKVLLFGAISAMAWNLLVLGAGLAVGGNAERLLALFETYERVAFLVLGAVALLWVARYLRRSRRAGKEAP